MAKDGRVAPKLGMKPKWKRDDVEVRPNRSPALYIPSTEPRFDESGGLWVIIDKLIFGFLIDDESVVESGLDAVIEAASNVVAQRFAAPTNLVEKIGERWALESPTVGRKISLRDVESLGREDIGK